jgi:hypothetical protein
MWTDDQNTTSQKVAEIFVMCQRNASAPQPLRYALVTAKEASKIIADIRLHTGEERPEEPLDAFTGMEKFIIDGRQSVDVGHNGSIVTIYLTRFSEASGEHSDRILLKISSIIDFRARKRVKKSPGSLNTEKEGPSLGLERNTKVADAGKASRVG